MGGLVIETVRPGVQFVPDAAAAFRRAEAQVRAEFGRGIDVNSTYRSWSDQMVMFTDWGRYVASGYRPAFYPGHSKAVHPSQSFHVQGIALDSDDWRVPRIVAILADHGFIRNRLHVKGEDHHFEWLRSRDNHYGEPVRAAAGKTSTPLKEDDMKMIGNNNEGYLIVDEMGADNIASLMFVPNGPNATPSFNDNLSALRALAGDPVAKGGWDLQLMRHVAETRWNIKRSQIAADIIKGIAPLLSALAGGGGITEEKFAELLEKGLAGVVVKAEPISEADRDAIAAAVREEFRENPLS